MLSATTYAGLLLASQFLFSPISSAGETGQLASRSVIFQVPDASFRPPKGRGRPRQSLGAGTRGSCLTSNEKERPLTALVPENKADPENSVGLTLRGHPQFLVYIPESSATMGEFYIGLEEEVDGRRGPQVVLNDVYVTEIKLPDEPGLISLQLPQEEVGLEVGQTYRWYFSITCDGPDRSGDPTVSGVVHRVDIPELSRRARLTSLLERVSLYAEQGIWYDTLAGLAALRQSNPDDESLEQEWQSLLDSDTVNLSEISQEPLIQCCQASNEGVSQR
ncbi:MAG: DUF928 domain-containing protein [Microcoleaceae cyanobacterium]